MQKKVLITGGAGYIGSTLTPMLLSHGYDVILLDRFLFNNLSFIKNINNDSLTIIDGDIRDKYTVNKAMRKVNYVIHLAALANDPSGDLEPEITKQINFDAYDILVNGALKNGVERFLNASSFSVYGKKDNVDITEDEKIEPLKDYGLYKAKSESLLKEAATDNFCTTSLRLATVCGWSPRMRFDLIVNQLTAMALQNNKLEIWGGDQSRPQIHVKDIARYFIRLLEFPQDLVNRKVFNAGGENATIKEIALLIQKNFKSDLELKFMPPRDDERSYNVSSKKIKEELGLEPKHTISDAINDIMQAKKKNLWDDFKAEKHNNVKMTLKFISNN